jgi:hypothetical protein
MNDDLAAYLDSLGGLLRSYHSYLDEDRWLSAAAARHLRLYAVAVLEGSISPEDVAEDWEAFFDLTDGFVIAYGSARLEQLSRRSVLLGAGETGSPWPLDAVDRLFLATLVCELDEYLVDRGRRDWDPTAP